MKHFGCILQGLGRPCAMRIWGISKEIGVLKITTYGAQDAPESDNGVYFAIP